MFENDKKTLAQPNKLAAAAASQLAEPASHKYNS